MVVPTRPAGGGGGRRSGRVGARASDGATVVDFVSAAVGLLVTLGFVAALLPALPAADHPLAFLAVTALVGLLVVGWLAVWTCLEIAWARRVGRPNGS